MAISAKRLFVGAPAVRVLRVQPLIAISLLTALAGCGSTLSSGSLQSAGSAPLTSTGSLELGQQNTGALGTPSNSVDAPGATAHTGVVTPTGSGGLPDAPSAPPSSPTQATSATLARNTTPINVGLLAPDSVDKAVAAMGAQSQGQGAAALQQGLVNGLNKHGGLFGRKINPVYYRLNPTSSDYNSALQAACASFTQDHHVAAVISLMTLINDSFEQCLNQHQVVHIEASTASASQRLLAGWPRLLLPDSPTMERRETGALQIMSAAGWLKSSNKIGVVFDSCPDSQDGYNNGLKPQAQKLGLSIASTVTVNCINGFGDVAGAASAMQSAMLRFRSATVDRVMFISNFEQTLGFYFQQYANSQGYKPGYAFSSNGYTGAIAPQWAASQLPNVRFAGSSPYVDVSPEKWPKSAVLDRCKALAGEGGATPNGQQDILYLSFACDGLNFYAALLSHTAGDSSSAAVLGAAAQASSEFRSAMVVGGKIDMSKRRDGLTALAFGTYQSACKCTLYTGQPTTIQ